MKPDATEGRKMIVLVKGANRKIYSKQTSRYYTLKDILELVQSGEEFQVHCRITKRNITPHVLSCALKQLELSQETTVAIIKSAV
jgi:polyhydroxyalkanoate synthesis regulator protein